MSAPTRKRTLDAFFIVPAKKARVSDNDNDQQPSAHRDHESEFSAHRTYPFPIPTLSKSVSTALASLPSSVGKPINDQPDLDLVYFKPYMPKYIERELFESLRGQLPFYRVEYNIKRGGVEQHVRTPRYTTVFGLDDTSCFDKEGEVADATTGKKVEKDKNYIKYSPRPIPQCLDVLRRSTEAATGCKFNFCLVNYYASGSDSIAYHSDDERFLGKMPAVASFSLGAERDFLMKHKPIAPNDKEPPLPEVKPIKMAIAGGDMILMRGKTQANWLHSIPKRTMKNLGGGRINITFRRVLEKCGTENYYHYNVGAGPVYKWDDNLREMTLWKA